MIKRKKVTLIDYQIFLLEARGSNLSMFEQNKLNSLKEQKTLMEEQGIQLKPTIVPRFPLLPPPPPKSKLETKGSPEKTDQVENIGSVDEEAVWNKDVPEKISVNKFKGKVATHGKTTRGPGVSSSFLKFVKYNR